MTTTTKQTPSPAAKALQDLLDRRSKVVVRLALLPTDPTGYEATEAVLEKIVVTATGAEWAWVTRISDGAFRTFPVSQTRLTRTE